MPAAYTELFGRISSTAAGATLLFATPITGKYVLRDLVVHNGAASAALVQVLVTTGTVNYYYLSLSALPPGTSQHLELRQALFPGQTLYLNTDKAGVTVTATGYHFDG